MGPSRTTAHIRSPNPMLVRAEAATGLYPTRLARTIPERKILDSNPQQEPDKTGYHSVNFARRRQRPPTMTFRGATSVRAPDSPAPPSSPSSLGGSPRASPQVDAGSITYDIIKNIYRLVLVPSQARSTTDGNLGTIGLGRLLTGT